MDRGFHHLDNGEDRRMTDEERRGLVGDGLMTVKDAQVFMGLSRSK